MDKTWGKLLTVFLLVSILTVSVNFQQSSLQYNTVSASTFNVPGDFPTIQQAVNNANDGDTITVNFGYYPESVVVNKSVTINGVNQPWLTGGGFSLYSNQTTINGFTLPITPNSITVYSSNNTIENNNVYGLIQISSPASNNLIARNNLTYNTQDGIRVIGSSGNTILGNTISGKTASGIYLQNSPDTIIQSNIIRNNGSPPDNSGIGIDSSSSCTIAYNVITNNYYAGIRPLSSNNMQIYGNIISGQTTGILWRDTTSGNIIYLNSFSGNTADVNAATIAGSSFNTASPVRYSYGGITFNNQLGNYWSSYSGSDSNGNGIGDTGYSLGAVTDASPLISPAGLYSLIPSGVSDSWPMFHHDSAHSGFSTSAAPNTNHTLWTYTTGDYVESSATVVDGKMYIGSLDGKVYCLNDTTGAFIWSFTADAAIERSSPAVVDGKVYFGSVDFKVYCLDATSGTLVWSYTTGSQVISSPAVYDGKVYIGSADREVYCLNATSGVFIWSYTTGGYVDSPAVFDDKVYIGSWDSKVYCLNASTGAPIWSYTTGNTINSAPTIVGGKVYIGSWDRNIYCLDATTGVPIWSYTTGGNVDSTPAVFDDKVYIGSWDSKVYCLNASTGAPIWSYTTGSYVDSSAAVVEGKVYIGSQDFKVYCFDAVSGAPLWSYKTGNWVFLSSPAVADGKVYIGSTDRNIYCFGSIPAISIQQAINSANPGDIVNIPSGTYYENVIINKTITLVGAGRDTTIINGQNISTTVTVSASNVSISGFEITNGCDESLLVESSAFSCVIHDNTVSFGYIRGIALFGGNQQVYGNIVHDIGFNTSANGCNGYGAIESLMSSYNSVFNNTIYASHTWGLGCNGGTYNQIYNNTVYSSQSGSLIDWSSHDNAIFNNTFYNDTCGTNFLNSAHGNLYFDNQVSLCNPAVGFGSGAYNNSIFGNSIFSNPGGVYIMNSTANRIYSNNITSNGYGLQIGNSSSNNRIYANRFTANNQQAFIDNSTGYNAWDNGYPAGGNYWSNYTGSDRFQGPSQVLFGFDGFGDTPYVIGTANLDNYPVVSSSVSQTPVCSFTVAPSSPQQNQAVGFDASASVPSTGNFSYRWNFGDGINTNQTTPTITHTYSSPGTYNVALTIVDFAGGQISNSISLGISATPTATPTPSPQTPTPTPATTATPTRTPSPANTTTPTPQPTEQPTIEPSPTPETSTTPTDEPSATGGTEWSNMFTLRQVKPEAAVSVAATTSAAATVATISAVAVTYLGQASASTLSTMPIPEPVKSFLKKYAESKVEKKLKKAKVHQPRKPAFIMPREIAVLGFSIAVSTLVVGFVKAGGFAKVSDLAYFSGFLFAALFSAVIVQVSTFGIETICSQACGVRKEYGFWTVGTVMFAVTGLAFMFPFSSPATTTYAEKMPNKVKGLTVLLKSLMLLMLMILFAFLTISNLGNLSKIGDAGLLLILTSICSSLVPLPPLAGKDIFDYKKALSAAILVPLVFLVVSYEVQLLPLWVYALAGIAAAVCLPVALNRLKNEKTAAKLKQQQEDTWCKSNLC
jgi:parallel beta-helix repeat protein